jgi:hypothetical protein
MLHTFTYIFGPFFPGLRYVHQLEPRWKGCCESLSTTLAVGLAPPVFQALSRYPHVVFFFSAIPFSVILWKYPICPQNADARAIANYNRECVKYRNRVLLGAFGFALSGLFIFTKQSETMAIQSEEIGTQKKQNETLTQTNKTLTQTNETLTQTNGTLTQTNGTLIADQLVKETRIHDLEEALKLRDVEIVMLKREKGENSQWFESKLRGIFLEAANCMSPSFLLLKNDTDYAVKVYTQHAFGQFGASFSPRIYEVQPQESKVVAGNIFSSLAGEGMWVTVGDSPAIFVHHGEIIEVSKLLKT